MADEQDSTSGAAADDEVVEVPETAVPEVETPAEAPPEPEKAPEKAAPVEPAKPVEVAKPSEPAVSPSQKRLGELTAQIEADDFDPYSKEGKKALLQRQDLAAELAAEPIRRQSVWTNLSADTDLTVKELKAAWTETLKEIPEKYKGSQDALDYAFERKIEAMQAAKAAAPVTPPAAAKPKAKATPVMAPGQVLPRGVGSVPPQPPAQDDRSIEERVMAGDPTTIKQFQEAYQNAFGTK